MTQIRDGLIKGGLKKLSVGILSTVVSAVFILQIISLFILIRHICNDKTSYMDSVKLCGINCNNALRMFGVSKEQMELVKDMLIKPNKK